MIKSFKQFLNEDAYADAGSVSGMGAVVTSQPSAIPGDVSGATTGSGDIGVPFMSYDKMPVTSYELNGRMYNDITNDKKKTKKKKLKNLQDIEDFLA